MVIIKTSCKITVAVLLVLLILAIAVIFFFINYNSPGIHTFGKYTHFELFETAYWIETGEMTDLTVYGTYIGTPKGNFSGFFKGYLQVGDCPIPFSHVQGNASDEGYPMHNQNGYLVFPVSYKALLDIDIEQNLYTFSDYQYYLILNPAKPEEIIICVYDKDNNPLGAVVNAKTPEEADRIYNEYSKTLQ